MKKSSHKWTSVAAVCLLLNACASIGLHSEYSDYDYESDTVISFARAKADSQTIAPNSIVMLGKQYVYVMEQSNADLGQILNAKLPHAFEIYDPQTQVQSPLTVKVQYRTPQNFQSEVCLRYKTDGITAPEQTQLNQLGFRQPENGYRHRCIQAAGKMYSQTQAIAADYSFEKSLPVRIIIDNKGSGNKALRMLLTPFAMAVDIVTLPVQAVLVASFLKPY